MAVLLNLGFLSELDRAPFPSSPQLLAHSCIMYVIEHSFQRCEMFGFEPATHPTGLEPAISRSEVWCIIHYATSCSTSWAGWPVREWSRRRLLYQHCVATCVVEKISKLGVLSYFTLIKSQPDVVVSHFQVVKKVGKNIKKTLLNCPTRQSLLFFIGSLHWLISIPR